MYSFNSPAVMEQTLQYSFLVLLANPESDIPLFTPRG